MVLIFSNKEDSHPTNVIKHLVALRVPVFRLNTECLLTDYEFSWWCSDSQKADFYIKNIKNGLEIYGHQITAIWDRRPKAPHQLPIVHHERSINRYNREEAHAFLSFIRYYLRNVFSIGSIVEDRPASSKMLQLAIAREMGMNIPNTCFANNKDAFTSLFEAHSHVSLKPIGDANVYINGEYEYVFFSKKVPSELVYSQPKEAFKQTVSFLQNYVEKKYELRVTVCCQDVIACKIDSQVQNDDTGKIDWRQGYEHDLKHEIVTLPKNIQQFCIDFLKQMKLNFGCFDFIVTPEDKYVFLECNPNGQWLWIELMTGYDISKIIAKNLAATVLNKQINNCSNPVVPELNKKNIGF